VFAIIEEPTSQMGPIRTILHRIMAPFAGQVIPGGTHPVVVERATGKRVSDAGALTAWVGEMKADLGRMSAREFHNRYLDM